MQLPLARRIASLSSLAARLEPAPAEGIAKSSEPVDILASMLDLRGSVRLAELLAELPPVLSECSESAGSRRARVEEVERRIVEILEQVPQAFESLRRPARVLRAIRAERELEAGARALAERFEEAMARAIAKGRADARVLRDEIGEGLRKESARSVALEQLDSALVAATRGVMSTRLASLVPFAVNAFERIASERLLAAGEGIDLARVETWCRPDGWLGRAVAEGEATALAVVRLEAGLVLALVEA